MQQHVNVVCAKANTSVCIFLAVAGALATLCHDAAMNPIDGKNKSLLTNTSWVAPLRQVPSYSKLAPPPTLDSCPPKLASLNLKWLFLFKWAFLLFY